MIFRVLLYLSLAVFLTGLIYKISTWFLRTVTISAGGTTTSHRVLSFVKGLIETIFSKKIITLINTLILDVILQRRILKEDFTRWLMHILIYWGFMLLLLMHAMGQIITASVFDDYYSTLNPFFFLRDLFGAFVIIGIAIAVFRRFILNIPRFRSNAMDRYAIVIVALIIISGILLEGTKITSYSVFTRMIEDYSGLDEEEDIRALESLWVKEFGLVSPNVSGPFEQEVLDHGMEEHEMNCLGCHSSPKWAFMGYASSKLIKPAALLIDRAKIAGLLYYIHILFCFLGLAFLPFSKMFHIISTPISLLANSVMDRATSDAANIETRQVMELDACMHCGTCSHFCSAMMGFESRGNPYILPSEKMTFLKSYSIKGDYNEQTLMAIQEGIYLCTNCDRCTVVCPAGINLKELWLSIREGIIRRGVPEPLTLSPFSLVRGLNRTMVPGEDYFLPLSNARAALAGRFETLMDAEKLIPLPITLQDDDFSVKIIDNTFAYCFGCRNCTNVCPVVDNYENPIEALGLLPHQIMCCLGLGLYEMASGPNMLWDCVTCYQCQEHCPQKVKVADILYDLKNRAKIALDKRSAAYSKGKI